MLTPGEEFPRSEVEKPPGLRLRTRDEQGPAIIFEEVDAMEGVGAQEVKPARHEVPLPDDLVGPEALFSIPPRKDQRYGPIPGVVVESIIIVAR